MSLSMNFTDTFARKYDDSRARYDPDQWKQLWQETSRWNEFMLYKPRSVLEVCVLQATAEGMGYKYWMHEPFRIDAAFTTPDFRAISSLPLPLIAAVEHENNPATFIQEIAKLSHIRSPLKIGITYYLIPANKNSRLEQVKQSIISSVQEIEQFTRVAESPLAEYVYLIGEEDVGMHITWHSFSYLAGEGPRSAEWKIILS